MRAAHDVCLKGCFPELADLAGAVHRVDEGWDCRVLILDAALVARLPRRPEVQARLQVERRLLAELEVGVPIPRPVRHCPAHGSLAYRLIAGTPLTGGVLDQVGEAVLAAQVADLLSALWSFPAVRATGLGVQPWDFTPVLDDLRRRVLPLVRDPRAAQLLDEADDRLVVVEEPVLVHADLGPAHLLCHETGLAGSIDWSDARIGDRATDLAWLMNGEGRRLRAPLVRALQVDPATLARADLLHALGPWWEVLHGLDVGRTEVVTSGLEGVRARLS